MNGMLQPEVSVIVPVYNAEAYLAQCIESILAQDYQNFELILVNDGSTDSSGEICERYAMQNSQIRLVKKPNGGLTTARNAGIKTANGKYIAFVDSDDWVDTDYLSILLKHMKAGGLSFCRWRNQTQRAEDESTAVQIMSAEEGIALVLDLSGKYGGVYCKLFDRELIERKRLHFSEDISYGEDLLFSVQYYSALESGIAASSQTPYYYRPNIAGMCNQRFSKRPGFSEKKALSEYEALKRCGQYVGSSGKMAEICELRTVKAAVASLRTIEVQWGRGHLPETYRELRHYVASRCVKSLFAPYGTAASRVSVLLCTLSPKLELMLWRMREKWIKCWSERGKTDEISANQRNSASL